MMNPNSPETIFVGSSEMARLMRLHDWSQTLLGNASNWASSLKTAVNICLNSRFPMVIWWGKDLVLLYNDAWRPILGTKHPKALGRPGREVWSEIWDIIGVQLHSVLETAQATWSDDMLLAVDRYGYTEEAYFTYSYSPIFLETGEVGGAFTAVTETTRRVIGERRLSTLRELAANTVEAKSVEEICQIASTTLANNPYDISFALLYLVEMDGKAARLVQRVRIEAGTAASPEQVDLTQEQGCWNLAQVKTTGNAKIIDELDSRLGRLSGGAWEEPSRSAIVLPIAQAGQKEQLAGLLVLGISPRREFDDEYQGFFDLVASNVGTAIANARAYEEERKRAESLAELDRAKTIFFSNVSHEFRTPLTLMLNPLEDTLANSDSLSPNDREQLEIAHRNSQRLLKLVNTLLDFSRIEAGRMQAVYEPTDLATLTADLAGVFRSAIERAGMRLQVDCPPLPEPVYVDREMWEKIVLNLLSNAFKFTFEGEISLSLRWESGRTLQASSAETDDFASTVQAVGANLGSLSSKLDGSSSEFGGSSLEFGSSRSEVEGSSLNLRGSRSEVEGSSLNLEGSSLNLGDSRSEVGGSRSEVEGSSLNLGSSRSELDTSTSKLRPSRSNLDGSQSQQELSTSIPYPSTASLPHVVLEVRDTGTGIPAEELPHIFERFHRVKGARGRSYEGSGIGLSLVQELVKLHNGTIQVNSVVDQGTRFTVSMPVGCAHLPTERIGATRTLASTAMGAMPYVEEMLRWSSKSSGSSVPIQPKSSFPSARILLADDNADMRDYLKRLLSQQYEVETVSDGTAALTAIRQQIPDLILTDVMMPGMDGFELLRLLRNPPLGDSLRSDPATQDIPIILLSARAGEEARVEGLEAGADDYLTKPFSARELLARVEATLKLSHLRREATQREQALNQQLTHRINELQTLFNLLPVGVAIAEDPACRTIRVNPCLSELIRVPIEVNASQSAPLDERPLYRLCRNGEELPIENLPMQYAALHNTEVKGEVLDLVHLDGTVVKLLSYCSPLLDEQDNVRGALGAFVDITQRVAIETALRESEERLRVSQELSLDAFTILDSVRDQTGAIVDFVWTYVNPKAAEILKHPVEELIGQRLLEVLPVNQFNSELFERYVRVVETGEPHDVELSHNADGISGWFRNMAVKLADGIAIFFSDITDRKRRELNANFLANITQDLTRSVNVDDLFQTIGDKVCHYFGLSILTFSEIDDTADRAQVIYNNRSPGVPDPIGEHRLADYLSNNQIEQLKTGRVVAIDDVSALDLEGGDAAYQLFQVRSTLIAPYMRDGRLEFVLSGSRNTPSHWRTDEIDLVQELAARIWIRIEHARIEADLRRSEAEFRIISNAAPALVWVGAQDGSVIFFNDRWYEFTGQTEAEAIGFGWTNATHPDDTARILPYWQHCRQTGEPYEGEVRYRRHDGEYCWYAFRALPRRNGAGEIEAWYGLSLDISDRKQAEAEREQLLIREQAAREAAEAANRIKDEFLAVVSHELRSPLNPILGWAKLLRSRQLDAEKTDRALEVIERNAQMQAQLINDLLDVSRILRGKLSLDAKPVDLVATIQAAMETVRLAAEAKSIQIHTQFEPDVGQVAGDAGRLQQVIWNLLTNAVKFTSEGGRVEVRLEQVGSQETLNRSPLPTPHSPPCAQITVTDTGKGIPSDFLPYVFEQFRQESSATTRRFGGLGLGLAIVRYLVELHGGTIQADSPGEEQGATFTVQLPLLGSREPGVGSRDKVDSPLSTTHSPLTGLRILVADDDADTREFLAFLLELHGANVIATATAGEALTTLTQFKPEVLLSDIGMPDVDGYMLMRQIRALPPEQGGTTPAIALTAYAGEIDYQQAMAAGFQRHVAKPIEPEILIQAIAELKSKAINEPRLLQQEEQS